MKSYFALGLFAALCAVAPASAQYGESGAPSLLPMPSVNHSYAATRQPASYYTRPVSASYRSTETSLEGPSSVVTPKGRVVESESTDSLPPPAEEGYGKKPCASCGTKSPADSYGSSYSSCGPTGCGDSLLGGCNPCISPWYAGVYGLYLTRDDDNFEQLSFDTADPVGQMLSTRDAGMGWQGGYELRVGRRFCGGLHRLEATYWSLLQDQHEATALGSNAVGGLNTAYDFGPLLIGGTTVNDLYDGAAAHRLRRDFEVHNVEINWVYSPSAMYGAVGGLQVEFLAGFRFFRFTEGWEYASADADPVFGADPANEVYYNIDVENNLAGFQIGGRADYGFGCGGLSVFADARIGVYGNHINGRSRIGNNVGGDAVIGPGNPFTGSAMNISSDKNDVSILGQIDLGLTWKFHQRWALTGGYRVMAISGIALASDQIPYNFGDIPGVGDLDSNAELILHGAYVGVEYNW